MGDLISGAGDIIGAIIGANTSEDVANKNIQMQQEFAQNGISWKVADAKRAGISPLYALGAPTSSFENVTGSNDLGEGIAKAGQDLGRAAMASADRNTKLDVLKEHLLEGQIASQNQDVIHQQLINSSLAKKMAAETATANGLPNTTYVPEGFRKGARIPYGGPAYESYGNAPTALGDSSSVVTRSKGLAEGDFSGMSGIPNVPKEVGDLARMNNGYGVNPTFNRDQFVTGMFGDSAYWNDVGSALGR